MKGIKPAAVLFASCLLLAVSALGNEKKAVLVEAGSARGAVLISDASEQSPGARKMLSSVEDAATEFVHAVHEISGAELPLERVEPAKLRERLATAQANGQTTVLLGSLALQFLGTPSAEARHVLEDPSGFVLSVSPGVVAIAGGTARGTEIGVHRLLEQLGMRWFFPGKLGTVVPSSPHVAVALQQTLQRPTFSARQFQLGNADDWLRHQPVGGPYFPGAHGISLGKGISVDNHPELFALVDGKRKGPQLCLSNPETLKLAVEQAREFFRKNPEVPWYGMGPQDKSGFCECDQCRALDAGDWDPFSGERSVTDRYIWFLNQVIAELKPEFPDKKIAFYIYHSYMRPPVRVKPDPHIVGALAPIALCRVHGMDNPVCPERSYLKTIVGAWTKLIPQVYERGYWFNLADPGMWFVQTSRLKDEIRYEAAQGIVGIRTECLGSWAVEGPSLYLGGRLMWDAGADTDALLKDYCEKLFGPAADSMREYFTLLDERLRDVDCHTGGAFDLLQFYPADFRKKVGERMARAQKQAAGTPCEKRVEIFAKGFDYADAFARMLEAEGRQDWADARSRLATMERLREALVHGYDVPMINAGAAKSYLDRFFRLPVEQGEARTRDGNRMAARLSGEWSFLIDPSSVGEALGYGRDGLRGGNWQKIQSVSKTWSDIGLRYYKGLAWYRQEVEIPKEFEGKRLFLWFGGVDERARVWINGKPVGNSPLSAFVPFELDATEALHPGRNSVAVCVANLRVDELGTGGITAPAFVYAPAKGAEAKLENLKPLRETFP